MWWPWEVGGVTMWWRRMLPILSYTGSAYERTGEGFDLWSVGSLCFMLWVLQLAAETHLAGERCYHHWMVHPHQMGCSTPGSEGLSPGTADTAHLEGRRDDIQLSINHLYTTCSILFETDATFLNTQGTQDSPLGAALWGSSSLVVSSAGSSTVEVTSS